MTKDPPRWSNKRGEGRAATWLREHQNYAGSDCLIWPFSRTPKGYGMLGHEGRSHYAHRFMCELVHGPAPEGKPQASHSCGSGHLGCVHPQHLAWASNSENQLDRRRHGTAQPRRIRRTNEKTLAAIRALKGIMTQAEIAAALGIAVGSVEYWQRHDRPLQRPGTSEWSRRGRRRPERRPKQTA